jgi:hypothetical protein
MLLEEYRIPPSWCSDYVGPVLTPQKIGAP